MTTTNASPRRRDWVDQSSCANVPRFGDTDTDKLICAACPVKYMCFNSALINNETGLWGGMDDKERSEWVKENRDLVSYIRSTTPLEPIERPSASSTFVVQPKTSKQLKKERATRMKSDPLLIQLLSEF